MLLVLQTRSDLLSYLSTEGSDKHLMDFRILFSILSGTISMLTLQGTYDNVTHNKVIVGGSDSIPT